MIKGKGELRRSGQHRARPERQRNRGNGELTAGLVYRKGPPFVGPVHTFLPFAQSSREPWLTPGTKAKTLIGAIRESYF